MASSIDDTKPIAGSPATANVRANFTAAKSEIEALQTWIGDRPVSVKDPVFGAVGDGVTDDTAAIQAALDASLDVTFPRGRFLISAALTVNPWANIKGAGVEEWIEDITDATYNTVIWQTAAAPVFTTDNGDLTSDVFRSAPRWGNIRISDMTLLGGDSTTQIGTYGVFCTSSSQMFIERVYAHWFTVDGFHFLGSLKPTLIDCQARYNQNAGVSFNYGPLGGGASTNCNNAQIRGGNYTQNEDYGVFVDIGALLNLNMTGVTIESTGSFFSGGKGYGLYASLDVVNLNMDSCYFEGNKIHAVIGDEDESSRITVPKNTRFNSCNFFSVTGGGGSGPKIVLWSGKGTIIENSATVVKINIHPFSDSPILKNNSGEIEIIDAGTSNVPYDVTPVTSTFTLPEISSWSTTNCTVAISTSEVGPVQNATVYDITESTPGSSAVYYAPTRASFDLDNHSTMGFWVKSQDQNSHEIFLSIATQSPVKVFTDLLVDACYISTEWKWVSIGRHILSSDLGDIQMSINSTTGSFYISDFRVMPGIVYTPPMLGEIGLPTLPNQSTPSVHGLTRCLTGGVITITDFDDGAIGQIFTLVSEHAITITDGTNIFLNGSANFVMAASDTLTVILKADLKWYELSRSVN